MHGPMYIRFQNIVGMEPRILCSIELAKRSVQDIDVEVEKCHSSRTITKSLRISGL